MNGTPSVPLAVGGLVTPGGIGVPSEMVTVTVTEFEAPPGYSAFTVKEGDVPSVPAGGTPETTPDELTLSHAGAPADRLHETSESAPAYRGAVLEQLAGGRRRRRRAGDRRAGRGIGDVDRDRARTRRRGRWRTDGTASAGGDDVLAGRAGVVRVGDGVARVRSETAFAGRGDGPHHRKGFAERDVRKGDRRRAAKGHVGRGNGGQEGCEVGPNVGRAVRAARHKVLGDRPGNHIPGVGRIQSPRIRG